MSSTKSILVPTDFTAVANCALDHAIKMANVIGARIWVLHVVNSDKKIADAKIKLDAITDELQKKHGNITFMSVAKDGSVFDVVGETAKELHC